LQHRKGFPDSGTHAEKDLQLSPFAFFFFKLDGGKEFVGIWPVFF
jgi:hypothetical protein